MLTKGLDVSHLNANKHCLMFKRDSIGWAEAMPAPAAGREMGGIPSVGGVDAMSGQQASVGAV